MILNNIKSCIARRKILWTYHVTMRMHGRSISRNLIIQAAQSYELLECYPDDKYMPSCLLRGEYEGLVFHVVCAYDAKNETTRIITAYKPSLDKWDAEGRKRLS